MEGTTESMLSPVSHVSVEADISAINVSETLPHCESLGKVGDDSDSIPDLSLDQIQSVTDEPTGLTCPELLITPFSIHEAQQEVGQLSVSGQSNFQTSESITETATNKDMEQVIGQSRKENAMSDEQNLHSKPAHITENQQPHYSVCDRHRVQETNIASSSSTSKPTLCQNCSKSMLSYIMIIQNFLDGLTVDISKQVDPVTQCVECVKEGLSLPLRSPFLPSSEQRGKSNSDYETSNQTGHQLTSSDTNFISGESSGEEAPCVKYVEGAQGHPLTSTSSNYEKKHESSTPLESQQSTQFQSVHYSETKSRSSLNSSQTDQHSHQQYQEKVLPPPIQVVTMAHGISSLAKDISTKDGQVHQPDTQVDVHHPKSSVITEDQLVESTNVQTRVDDHHPKSSVTSELQSIMSANGAMDDMLPISIARTNITYTQDRNIDGIVSVLYNIERELRDLKQGEALWEKLIQIQQVDPSGAPPKARLENEAFVTIARNNIEVLGCLVLGSSLLLCGTSRTLCVLVFDGVCETLMEPLSSVFQVVLHIRSLDSEGTTKLALLDQPELGISIGKLNVWRLEQFTKCVYLNPDTVAVQNCDELFSFEELSAVPDIGWPDCFNSAVFVFSPSVTTFCQLLKFAEDQGSYDGGDQGLLNTYFNSWSYDINKKLSFIYNLMANVSYTYTPAFRQFGRNVKIVQFMGHLKPWHINFYSSTGQIAPSSSVHPTFAQFVNIWLNIFRVCVLKLFSREIQIYTQSQAVISGYDLLKFFPSGFEIEVDFLASPSGFSHPKPIYDTPPSNVVEALKLPPINTSVSTTEDLHQPHELEKLQLVSPDDVLDLPPNFPSEELQDSSPQEEQESDDLPESEEQEQTQDKLVDPEILIPGSELGDYHGMSAWEQGRMDYEGSARSDTIIKRLHYLIEKSDKA